MGDAITGMAIWAVVLGLLALIIWAVWRLLCRKALRMTALLIVFVVVAAYFVGFLFVALSIWPLHY